MICRSEHFHRQTVSAMALDQFNKSLTCIQRQIIFILLFAQFIILLLYVKWKLREKNSIPQNVIIWNQNFWPHTETSRLLEFQFFMRFDLNYFMLVYQIWFFLFHKSRIMGKWELMWNGGLLINANPFYLSCTGTQPEIFQSDFQESCVEAI